MSKISYPNTSPYALTTQTNQSINMFAYRNIPSAADDKTLTLSSKYQYRPDILSNDVYGTPVYWWVFIVRNRNIIKDPIWDMVSGISIIIPSYATISKYVGT